jgi:hypothetical protein
MKINKEKEYTKPGLILLSIPRSKFRGVFLHLTPYSESLRKKEKRRRVLLFEGSSYKRVINRKKYK